MSDTQDPTDGSTSGDASGDASGSASGDAVGSVGEETAKLLGALSEWARDSSGLAGGLGAGLGESLSGFADHAAASVAEVNAHVATGSAECAYCPICRTVHVVRQTSPEVKAHLATAATSLLQALMGMLATTVAPSTTTTAGVERIDLDDPDVEDEGT